MKISPARALPINSLPALIRSGLPLETIIMRAPESIKRKAMPPARKTARPKISIVKLLALSTARQPKAVSILLLLQLP